MFLSSDDSSSWNQEQWQNTDRFVNILKLLKNDENLRKLSSNPFC